MLFGLCSAAPVVRTNLMRPTSALVVAVVVGLIHVGLSGTAAWAQLPSSRLDHLKPCGGVPGSTLEMTLSGADLDEASELIFEHPGITAAVKSTVADATNPATPIYGQFNVTIDASVEPGIYEVRARGRFGLSNPRRFVVDRLATVVSTGANRTAETAQTVSVANTVDGRIDAGQRDYFRIELKQGEQVLFEALTSVIDSRLAATVEVLDLDGNELARFRGLPETTTRGSFTAPADSVYLVSVYDLLFAGGVEHFYRLRIHRGPLIEYFKPAVVANSGVAQIEVFGRGLGEGAVAVEGSTNGLQRRTVALDVAAAMTQAAAAKRVYLPISALDELNVVPLSVSGPDGSSVTLPIVVSDLPVIAEVESEDEWQPTPTAQSIALPCVIDGTFAEARDRDWFEFSGKAGERWIIEVFADRLGMPTDTLIAVHQMTINADGTVTAAQVALADDAGDRAAAIGTDFDLSSDDATVDFTLPADGTFRISLDDQFGGTRLDPSVRYLLRVRPAAPRVRLVVQPPLGRPANDQQAILGSYEVRKGGTERINILVQRLEGAAVPITISIEGLPAGLVCDPVKVEPFAASAFLVVRAADDAAAWAGPVRIVGRWNEGEVSKEVEAMSGSLSYGTDNRAIRIALPRMAQSTFVSVVNAETEPVALKPSVLRVMGSRGAQIPVPLVLEKRLGFDGALTFNPVVSHGELKIAPVAIEAGKGEATVTIDMTSANLPVGVHQFMLQGDVPFKYVRNPDQIVAAEAKQQELAAALVTIQSEKDAAAALIASLPELRNTQNAARQVASEVAGRAEAQLLSASRSLVSAADAREAARTALAADANDAAAAAALAQAQTDLDAATAAVQESVSLLRTSRDAITSADAELAALAARETAATEAMTQADLRTAEVTTQKTVADQMVEAAKAANQPADRTYTAFSPQFEVVVEASPMAITASGNTVTVGGSVSLPVDIERRYGFAGPVTIAATPAASVAGLSITGGEMAAETGRLELAITTTAETPAGEVLITITATSKFNNLDVSSSLQVPISIVPGS